MKVIRLAYPRQLRLYRDPHLCSRQQHRTRADPTYASFLNRIEATFGALDEFVCKNADYLDWDAFGHALADHVRHRNAPAERERRSIDAAKRRERRAAKTNTKLKLAAFSSRRGKVPRDHSAALSHSRSMVSGGRRFEPVRGLCKRPERGFW